MEHSDLERSNYQGAPALENTEARQEALRRYHILDTAPEKNFDQVTRLVSQVTGAPTALITLLDRERQWFKSCFGYDTRETDIEVSFCAHAVHQRDTLVVEDATEDPYFKDNPLVTGDPGWRFYAGAPLETPEGILVGTLCIVDYEPRVFDASQRAILEDLADLVVGQFELRSAEAQYRKLFEGHPQPAFIYDTDSLAVLDANAAAARTYGYRRDELRERALSDLVAPASLEEHTDRAADRAADRAGSFTARHRRSDGTAMSVEVREESLLYHGRQARVATMIDVADRARGREYERIVENVQEVVFETDLEGKITFINAAWERLTGFSAEDALGKSLLQYVHPKDRVASLQAFAPLLQRRQDVFRHQNRFLTKGGGELPMQFRARLISGDAGTPVGTVGTLAPIEEAPIEEAPIEEAPIEEAPIEEARPQQETGTDEAGEETTFDHAPGYVDPLADPQEEAALEEDATFKKESSSEAATDFADQPSVTDEPAPTPADAPDDEVTTPPSVETFPAPEDVAAPEEPAPEEDPTDESATDFAVEPGIVDEPPEEATKEEADEGTPPALGDESPFESEKIAPLEEEPAFEEEGPPPLPDTEASVEDEAVEEFLPPAPGDEVGDKDEDFDEDFGKELFGGFPKPEERAEKDTPAPFPDEPADAPSLEKEPTSLEEEPTSEESFSEDRLFPVDESESLEEADEPQSAAFDDERPGDSAAPPLSDDESARDEAEGMGEETEAASGDFPELETLQDDASFGGDEPLSDIRQRLSAEPPELDVSSLDFTEHLRTTLDELEPAARRKGLMMHRALPSRELSIETDAGALRLLVAALVNNAITSTDEGSITVSGREEDDEALRLRVVDTGADISKSLLNSLLNIQITEGEDDDEESQEQHMKFVHRLVNLMQGSVEMESQRGRGTVFTVTLPRHADRLSSGETADALPSEAAAAPEDSSSPATPSSGDGADAWSGWGGSEWNAPEEASPEETASEESAYDESATSPEAPEHDQAPSTDSDEPAPPARDGSDSIFSTSPESDEDAEDDPDAFRSNPDSPFSF